MNTIPWPLLKATQDSFQYACGLRNGQVIEFENALIVDDVPLTPNEAYHGNGSECSVVSKAEWVELRGAKIVRHLSDKAAALFNPHFSFDRGLVVRISEIVWIADAPHGS